MQARQAGFAEAPTDTRRIACIWLPRFTLRVAASLSTSLLEHDRNAQRQFADQVLVALYRPGTRWCELLECSPALEAKGILPGLPLREAQARIPHAAYLPCEPAVLDAAAQRFEAILEMLSGFSPIVEPPGLTELGDGRAAAFMDVAGLDALYGADAVLAQRLAQATASAIDLEWGETSVGVGIASSRFTAWVAASLAARLDGAAHYRRPRG